MALNLEHRLNPRLRTEREAQSPTGHCVRLRKRSADHHARPQLFRQLAGGEWEGWRISEIQITFVTDNPNVVGSGCLDDLANLVGRDNASRGIIWRVDDQ